MPSLTFEGESTFRQGAGQPYPQTLDLAFSASSANQNVNVFLGILMTNSTWNNQTFFYLNQSQNRFYKTFSSCDLYLANSASNLQL